MVVSLCNASIALSDSLSEMELKKMPERTTLGVLLILAVLLFLGIGINYAQSQSQFVSLSSSLSNITVTNQYTTNLTSQTTVTSLTDVTSQFTTSVTSLTDVTSQFTTSVTSLTDVTSQFTTSDITSLFSTIIQDTTVTSVTDITTISDTTITSITNEFSGTFTRNSASCSITSVSGVMTGLGFSFVAEANEAFMTLDFSITPPATANLYTLFQIMYGDSTLPVCNHPQSSYAYLVVGNQFQQGQFSTLTDAMALSQSITATGLTIGTSYWVDLEAWSSTGATWIYGNAQLSLAY